MIDAVVKQKWIEALRSGQFTQEKGKLRHDYGYATKYCCLGVLCEVLGWRINSAADAILDDSGVCAGYRPLEAVGLPKLKRVELVSLNDSGRSFAEIADWIEKNL